MACSVLLTEVCHDASSRLPGRSCCYKSSQHVVLQKDEFLRLIINSIRNDLISRNEAFQALALSFIGNGLSST